MCSASNPDFEGHRKRDPGEVTLKLRLEGFGGRLPAEKLEGVSREGKDWRIFQPEGTI